MARTVRGDRFADKAKALINGNVVLVAKAGDRNVDLGLTACSGTRLDKLHGPAGFCIFLCCLGGLVRPDLVGCFARLDRVLFGLRVALLGSRNEGRVYNLAAHGEIAIAAKPVVKRFKQQWNGLRLGQPFTKDPDRIGIRCRSAKIKAQETQPTQPIPDQIFHTRFAHIILKRPGFAGGSYL